MPFVNVKLTKKLEQTQKSEIKSALGSAICVFPGKSESWLMCSVEDGKDMYFKGTAGDCAFVEVKLFGDVSPVASDKFTGKICEMLSTYGIPSDRVYVRYEGGTLWGWNGGNF